VPEASVIVPARDAAGTLGRTLDCLARQAAPFEFEVIVVDDGSEDGTLELARSAGVTAIPQAPLGAAQARNRGAAEAGGRALAFLDADCYPEPGWLAAGLRALEGADLVQGRVLPDPQTPPGPFDRTLWITENVGLWQTANLFVGRELFDRVGGFEDWLDVEVGKLMAEDVWFGWRAQGAGARPAFCSDALAYHAVFPRGPLGYVAERRRTRYFPAIARRMPELRRTMFFRGVFLSRRTATCDVAICGLALALRRRSILPLAALLPYARLGWRDRLRGRSTREAAIVAAVDAVADALTAAELVRGSVRSRSLVL
jgi:glycosyltransferase involved in cell wall biosynthesis